MNKIFNQKNPFKKQKTKTPNNLDSQLVQSIPLIKSLISFCLKIGTKRDIEVVSSPRECQQLYYLRLCSRNNYTLLKNRLVVATCIICCSLSLSSVHILSHFITLISTFSILTLSFISHFLLIHFVRRMEILNLMYLHFFFSYVFVMLIYSSSLFIRSYII